MCVATVLFCAASRSRLQQARPGINTFECIGRALQYTHAGASKGPTGQYIVGAALSGVDSRHFLKAYVGGRGEENCEQGAGETVVKYVPSLPLGTGDWA